MKPRLFVESHLIALMNAFYFGLGVLFVEMNGIRLLKARMGGQNEGLKILERQVRYCLPGLAIRRET